MRSQSKGIGSTDNGSSAQRLVRLPLIGWALVRVRPFCKLCGQGPDMPVVGPATPCKGDVVDFVELLRFRLK